MNVIIYLIFAESLLNSWYYSPTNILAPIFTPLHFSLFILLCLSLTIFLIFIFILMSSFTLFAIYVQCIYTLCICTIKILTIYHNFHFFIKGKVKIIFLNEKSNFFLIVLLYHKMFSNNYYIFCFISMKHFKSHNLSIYIFLKKT